MMSETVYTNIWANPYSRWSEISHYKLKLLFAGDNMRKDKGSVIKIYGVYEKFYGNPLDRCWGFFSQN